MEAAKSYYEVVLITNFLMEATFSSNSLFQVLLKKDDRCFNALLSGLKANKKGNVVKKLEGTLECVRNAEESEEKETSEAGK